MDLDNLVAELKSCEHGFVSCWSCEQSDDQCIQCLKDNIRELRFELKRLIKLKGVKHG